MPPRTLSWWGSPPAIIPSDPQSPAPCSEQKETRRISEFVRRRLSSLLIDVAVDLRAAPPGMMHMGLMGSGGWLVHLFAKTNGIITPICHTKAGPNSTCSKTEQKLYSTLSWLMIKPLLVYLVLNMSSLDLLTEQCPFPVSEVQPILAATQNATSSCVLGGSWKNNQTLI